MVYKLPCLVSLDSFFGCCFFFPFYCLLNIREDFLSVNLHRRLFVFDPKKFYFALMTPLDPTLNNAAPFIGFWLDHRETSQFFTESLTIFDSQSVPPPQQRPLRWHSPRQSLTPPCCPKFIQQQAVNHLKERRKKNVKKKKDLVGSVITSNKPRAEIE